MTAGAWSFVVEQGATFGASLTWRDAAGELVPLAGLAARMQLRTRPSAPDVVLELSTANGRLALTDPGVIRIALAAEDTAALPAIGLTYDLELVDPTTTPETVTRLLAGSVAVVAEVTRPVPVAP